MTETRRPVPIFGWTTCLTYESRSRLGYEHFAGLLENMTRHGMSRLVIMTATHYHFDPNNHGIAWPVRNPALRPMVDANAVNAHPETEFLSRIIDEAKARSIEVFFEVKYAGMVGLRETYPGITVWTSPSGQPHDAAQTDLSPEDFERLSLGHVCLDNGDVRRFMRDQITDLLEVYPGIDGIVMEWPGYNGNGCYCPSTREAFMQSTGSRYEDAPRQQRLDWQNLQVAAVLGDLRNLVKADMPSRRFGLFTGFSPADGDIKRFQEDRGHRIDTLESVGLDLTMPYCEGRHLEHEESEMERVIDYLDPLPCYIHCTIRRNPPGNYPVPPKNPEYIRRMIEWFSKYFDSHAGRVTGMSFFNEANIPDENRSAVYENVRRSVRNT